MKMLEYVPTAIPINNVTLKSRRTLPPKKKRARTGNKVVVEVITVRAMVWLTDRSTISV